MRPREKPCPTCPYRRSCPSGLWAEAEYDSLAAYDGTTGEQAMAGAVGVLRCHQGAELCAGWCAVHGDDESLGLRMAAARGLVDPDEVRDYTTDVPLFASGAEAAEHGKREIEYPGPEAQAAKAKISRVRSLRGERVWYE
jgi:hypothetical protein